MVPVLHQYQKDGIVLSGYDQFSPETMEQILNKISRLPREGEKHRGAPLEGRGLIHHIDFPETGPLVVKQFSRGGLLRYVVRTKYLRFGGLSRSQAEFEMLRHVRALGVFAPEPVAFATQGGSLYRAWIVMREIPNAKSLAQLSFIDEELTEELAPEFLRQIEVLVRHQIFHLDLHPGNVLVDETKQLWILDFDKAHTINITPRELKELYLRRWRRAVIKHALPDYLAELVCGGLLRMEPGEVL